MYYEVIITVNVNICALIIIIKNYKHTDCTLLHSCNQIIDIWEDLNRTHSPSDTYSACASFSWTNKSQK
jgi:hypothetical protein